MTYFQRKVCFKSVFEKSIFFKKRSNIKKKKANKNVNKNELIK